MKTKIRVIRSSNIAPSSNNCPWYVDYMPDAPKK
jgi:hypothetical protein